LPKKAVKRAKAKVASKKAAIAKSHKPVAKARPAKAAPLAGALKKSLSPSAGRGSSAKTAKPGKSPNKVRIVNSNLGTRGEGQSPETVSLDVNGLDSRSGGQSGALQGLSDVESADSESVDELLEEGNSFEAGIIKGVQDAPDADEEEVHTHERPQEKDLDEDFREN